MVTTKKLAKATGWLIILGPAVDVILVLLKPGTFITEHADGPSATMNAVVEEVAAGSGVAHLSVEVGVFAAFAFLLGCFGVERLLRDGSWGEYLRKAGLLLILVAFTARLASFAMGHLVGNILTHGGLGTGDAQESAALLIGVEGTLVLFYSLLFTTGIGFFGLSLMNANLIGADKVVAILFAIAPALIGVVMLLLGSHIHDGVLTFYLIGNLMLFVQVIWTTLLGAAFIRKSDSVGVS